MYLAWWWLDNLNAWVSDWVLWHRPKSAWIRTNAIRLHYTIDCNSSLNLCRSCWCNFSHGCALRWVWLLWAQNPVIFKLISRHDMLKSYLNVVVEVFQCTLATVFREAHLHHSLQMLRIGIDSRKPYWFSFISGIDQLSFSEQILKLLELSYCSFASVCVRATSAGSTDSSFIHSQQFQKSWMSAEQAVTCPFVFFLLQYFLCASCLCYLLWCRCTVLSDRIVLLSIVDGLVFDQRIPSVSMFVHGALSRSTVVLRIGWGTKYTTWQEASEVSFLLSVNIDHIRCFN